MKNEAYCCDYRSYAGGVLSTDGKFVGGGLSLFKLGASLPLQSHHPSCIYDPTHHFSKTELTRLKDGGSDSRTGNHTLTPICASERIPWAGRVARFRGSDRTSKSPFWQANYRNSTMRSTVAKVAGSRLFFLNGFKSLQSRFHCNSCH